MSQLQIDIPATQNDIAVEPGLRIHDLRKTFISPQGETVEVLRNVDLTVRPGEMVAITGASGSGKSTLLNLIGGLEEPTHGTIFLYQMDIARASETEITAFRRRNIAFVFQFHHLLADLSASENVALPLLIARHSAKEARDRAHQALEELGLLTKAGLGTRHLSGGEQQKVAVARALIREPSLVLADEPTGNLDDVQGDEIATLLRNYCRRRGAIILVATHNQMLGRSCDRKFAILNGRLHPAI